MSKPLAPCGTRAAMRRHKYRGESCHKCPTIGARQPEQPCGTPAAYRKHLRNEEAPCAACREACRLETQAKRARASGSPKKEGSTRTVPLNPKETAEEVTFLLNCGEGEHAILKALNITQSALETRLRRARRGDLIPRIFNTWDLAA